MTDYERVLIAVEEAQAILAAYVEPGPMDCEETIKRLLGVLNAKDLVLACRRIRGDAFDADAPGG